ncbi:MULTISPECIES: hypothetical protein [unclassified Prochlorococcus]|uniref:hypothetical protein n=1 Tax=unclassified Prochlorococcus TaxID=2627481 RepID=UPI00187C46E4|nr:MULTISPECIES: hypothetical protein [unclassified Prochlorococcus]
MTAVARCSRQFQLCCYSVALNQIPEDWHQVAVRFRRANGIRDGDMSSASDGLVS